MASLCLSCPAASCGLGFCQSLGDPARTFSCSDKVPIDPPLTGSSLGRGNKQWPGTCNYCCLPGTASRVQAQATVGRVRYSADSINKTYESRNEGRVAGPTDRTAEAVACALLSACPLFLLAPEERGRKGQGGSLRRPLVLEVCMGLQSVLSLPSLHPASTD
ncbi:hypothetical protein DPEC_G00311470 [Dallia pectoralis]|uniref:Uncharacterized protein n=1 Tax=Dallia pectoralis TaxID=75939 RepID=A0ACC2FBL6_DALPE|nr:hypothetical protein DPEC_G00311470 [Dallia pectoralis]